MGKSWFTGDPALSALSLGREGEDQSSSIYKDTSPIMKALPL